jgi:FtsZ-interacting cell division protein ZipA
MEIIWEKADYLLRLLFCIVFGIACILIVIAPLYASRHEQSGQRSDEKASVDGEEKVPDNGPEPEK